MYLNAVYCLGHMGVVLAQMPHTQELILQFLQQNLNPAKLLPQLEIKSMEQLGCMVIGGSVSINKLFNCYLYFFHYTYIFYSIEF